MYFKFFHIFFCMASLYFFEIFLVFEKIKSITLEAQEEQVRKWLLNVKED